MRVWLAIGFVGALVLGCLVAGALFAVGCNETAVPGVTSDVCDTAGSAWTFTWWLAVLWPACLFVLPLLLVPKFREHGEVVAVVTTGLSIAFWIPLLVHVTSSG